MKIFKKGDIVVLNSKYKHMISPDWWKKWKDKLMTVEGILTHGSIRVKENVGLWNPSFFLLYNADFIKEDEFKV